MSIPVNYIEKGNHRRLKGVYIRFTDDSSVSCINEVGVRCRQGAGSLSTTFGSSSLTDAIANISGDYALSEGVNVVSIYVNVNPESDLTGKLRIYDCRLILQDNSALSMPSVIYPELRFATVLRSAGQDNCDTYRIPGIVTTNAGTLIAVYDNRYNNSKDLQEDIDIGMSRSTDGGQTWEPMKVIMDMGEYGGRSEQLNGIGDPSILYDHKTNTVWVAAMWMSGLAPDKMVWWDSKPGIMPEETGQFMLVKSTDDGLTWSQLINITEQIKDPAWQLLFQGPGRGIILNDGTLVFPAQFKADIGAKAIDGGQYTCHSTVIYSRDGGTTWNIGTGAKTNTTEAQVVELSDGSLMLNMRDDRNRIEKGNKNGRAVAVTRDMGETWATHPSSNSILPEPNCMASLISVDLLIGEKKKRILFFSNPNDKSSRTRMTVKASLDEGLSWPRDMWVEYYHLPGNGYSCLTIIDEKTIGVLYEGIKELYFQKIPIHDIIPIY